MVVFKKNGYFIFTILFGILVTLIYFLFSWRINSNINSSVEKFYQKNDNKIIFANKYNLPLINLKIIINHIWFSGELVD